MSVRSQGKHWVYVLRCYSDDSVSLNPSEQGTVSQILENGRWYIGETGRLNTRLSEHMDGKTISIRNTPPGLRLCVYDVHINQTVRDLMYDLERPNIEGPDYYPEGYNTTWWNPPNSKYNSSVFPRFKWGLLKHRLENGTYDRKEGNYHLLLETEITEQFMNIGKADKMRPLGAGWCKESRNVVTREMDYSDGSVPYNRPLCDCGYPCEVKCNPDLRKIYYCCVVKVTKWLCKYDSVEDRLLENKLTGCNFRENMEIKKPVLTTPCDIDSD